MNDENGLMKPCPVHIEPEYGEKVYCEQGPEGHSGTHVGDKSQDQYNKQLAWWERNERNQ